MKVALNTVLEAVEGLTADEQVKVLLCAAAYLGITDQLKEE